MKKLPIILGLLLALSLVVVGFGCNAEEPIPSGVPPEGPVPLPPEEAGKDVSVDDSYAGKEVEVAVGGSLTVHLKSDPATGFEWELVTITDETVLVEVEHEYVGPEAEAPEEAGGEEEPVPPPAPAPAPPPPPAPVLPKEEWWTFKALKQGESIISMEYSQPREGGTKAARTFVLTVIVK